MEAGCMVGVVVNIITDSGFDGKLACGLRTGRLASRTPCLYENDVHVTVEDGIEDLKPDDLKPDIVRLISYETSRDAAGRR